MHVQNEPRDQYQHEDPSPRAVADDDREMAWRRDDAADGDEPVRGEDPAVGVAQVPGTEAERRGDDLDAAEDDDLIAEEDRAGAETRGPDGGRPADDLTAPVAPVPGYEERADEDRLDEDRAGDDRADENRLDENRLDENRADEDRLDEDRADEDRAEDARVDAEDVRAGDEPGSDVTTPTMAEAPASGVVAEAPPAAGTAEAAADTTGPRGEMLPGEAPGTPVESLWAAGDADGFRTRWRDVQLRFVDDPHGAAQEAEALVGDAVDKMTMALTARRDDLADWHSAGTGDTEVLRMALRRYRDFLDRVLGL
jgi:hypothetical protein